MFDNPADNFENGSGEFEEIGGIPPVPARKPRQRMNKAVLIGGAAGLLLIAVLVFLLIPKKEVVRTIDPGLSAPTGTAELIAPGVRLLTNELLVTVKDGTSLADLESQLEDLEGAVTGYMPALRQYQVRFNTSSREELDGKKDGAAGLEVAERVDYNLLIALETDEKPGNSAAFFPGDGEKIGILGVLPSQGSGSKPLFLPSADFGDRDAMTAAGLDDPAGREAAAAMADGREVTYASAFYYTKAPDGSLSRCTTTAALRYQIAALAEAGAEVICIPGAAPTADDPLLEGEAAQTEALLKILAEKNGRLMIIKAGRDIVTAALTGSAAGEERTLAVLGCGESDAPVLDLTGTGRKVYRAGSAVHEGEVCATGKDDCTAALFAAACAGNKLKNDTSARPEDLIRAAREGGNAAARDPEGRTVPVIADAVFALAAGTPVSGLRTVMVIAEDEVSGRPVENAALEGTFGSAGMTGGRMLAILDADSPQVITVRAGEYGSREAALTGTEQELHVRLPRTAGETGIIRGRVKSADGGPMEDLRIRVTEMPSGSVWPEKEISGDYRIPAYPGSYEVTILAHDRTPVTVHSVTVTGGGETELENVTLSVPSDLPGTVTGTIKDAMNGNGLGEVTLRLYPGIGAQGTGTPAAETMSRGDGSYEISLPGGQYTMKALKEGYEDGAVTVRAEGEIRLPDQNCTITPKVPEGQTRIVLEWGEQPSDLDSHLANRQQGIHVYYPDNKKVAVSGGQPVVNLDVDEVSSFGPETTTILVPQAGKYTFYVHNFTDRDQTVSRTMADSEARVTVYMGNGEQKVFTVPDEYGTLWEVFTLENGILTPTGRMSYQSSSESIGR